jgi:serine/threonine-protein kinase
MIDSGASVCGECQSAVAATARYCPACGSAVVALGAGEIVDGKYEILGKVGEGGMGEVYRARHLHLDEVRIIKIMKPIGAEDDTPQRRFADEAKLASQIRHPNVAALYDYSRLPSGSFYMVWEFIDGETLLHRLRWRGRFAADEAIDVSLQVLDGLAEIHRAGIVHRDISPDNIMTVENSGRRIAKIIDLGIAKKIANERLGMTGTGMFVGKLKYCSPEQAGALPPGELDGRSDLYSFGAVLYEMLSGKPLFEAPTPEGYIAKHLQEPPPELRRDDLPAELGEKLSNILARALAKDRNSRFGSAGEFAAALRSLRRATSTMPTVHLSTEIEPTAPLARPRSRKARWAVSSAVAALLAAGLFAIVYARREVRRNAASAPAQLLPATSAGSSTAPPPAPPPPRLVPPGPPKIVETRVTPAHAAHRVPVKPAEPAVPPPASETPTPRAAAAEAPPAAPIPAATGENEADAIRKFRQLRRSLDIGTAQDVDAFVEFVSEYMSRSPSAPLSTALRMDLPLQLKTAGNRAYGSGHPYRALRMYQVYKRLPFSPADPEVDARLEDLRSRLGARKGESRP